MADYRGQIRLSVQGLDQVWDAGKALGEAADNADRLANTKIQLRVADADSLGKLANQMSAIEARALDLASAVSRIGSGAATVKFNAKLDRQSLSRELDLVSRQFQRRNWRLNVNDTSVKTARLQVEKLGKKLQEIVDKKYVINVDYKYNDPPSGGRSGGRPPAPPKRPAGPGGASPGDIARRAGEAMAGGLTARLYSDAVAGARSSAARQGLIERFEQRVQRPQSPGGINQSLARRYLEALGGAASKGASPQELRAEVERLLRTVDESVISSITSRIDELKLSLQMPRNLRPPARALPNFNELLERMAAQTTRPTEAGRMLQMLPSRAITTDLAGLASRQAAKYIGPDMIPRGADELFNEIRRLFGNYFKRLNPTSAWVGPERKPYALQEIMAWQPWMAEPRERRGRKMLPAAGETARTVPVTDLLTLQTSYDEEIAKRSISKFAREVFGAQRRPALPPASGERAIVPANLYNQVIPVTVKDISQPAVRGIFNVGTQSFAGGGAGMYQMFRRPAGQSPAVYGAGSRPYQEPNWNELMDRMAAVTRNPAAASRRLRALPRQMVTTDLAGLATDQAAGMFGRADPLGERIRDLSRQAGLAYSPLDRISDAFRNASSSASAFIAGLRASFTRPPGGFGGGSGGGGGTGGGFGGSGGGGGTPRPFRRTTRRPDSATVDVSQLASGALYAGLTQTSADERRRGQFADVLDNYVRAVVDGEQAQRSLNADIERTAQAIQSARRAYVEAGATQALTADQVRATRSGIIRERRANFAINQRRAADQIQALEEQRAPIDIFRNYGQLQNLYGQLPITERRGALRGLRNARRGAIRDVSSEVLIGGAFPLLFGQGAATAAGGAIGGAASLLGPGAGFAGGLVGSAIGMQIDMLTTNLSNLAGSLKSPNDAMAALEANGYRVSDSLKFQVEQLQSVGRAYDAQTLVLQEVQKRLGPGSLTELTELDTAQKRLQESWAAIGAEIQVRLLPVLQGFVEFLGIAAGDIGGFASQSRLQRLDSAKFEELRTQAIRETARGPFGSFGDKAAFDTRLNELTRQELSRRFAGERAQVSRSPQEAFADETTRIQESRRVADQIQSAYREAFNLQRQAHDLQREGADINKEIADYSYKKQREIFDLRQQVAEKEIENNRAAAQNRIERGDLGARQAFAAAVGFEQQLLSNVREVVRSRKEGEADIEQSRRKLELTMAKLNRDTEDYKRTNAREIEDIERRKLAYVRSVEDYRMRVADYVRDRAREAADLMRQAMAQGQVEGGGAVGGSAPYVAVSPTQRIPFLLEIDRAAREANVDPRLFAGLVKQESSFRPGARSNTGAIGLAQLMPGTARELGVDPFNIQENLRGGARYLRQMIDRFGLEGGLRAYNQGPGAQQRTPGGNSQRSREYPSKVLANARAFGFNPAAMPPPATMGGAAFGRTGRMSLREGYGMVDLRGSSREAIIADAADAIVNRAAMGMRTWIGGGGGLGIEATNLRGQELIAALRQGMRAHETRGRNPATAIDLIAKLGEPLGIPVGGISNRGGATGVAGTTARGTIALHLTPESIGKGATGMQAMAAGQISSIPAPQFNPTPIGPTPSAAPINAERMAVLTRATGNEKEAQQILENEIKLREKGIQIGQLEQILQSNQLPQLKQQGDEIRRQTEARRQNLALSDQDASIADIAAEGEARLTRLLEERRSALENVQKQYPRELELIKLVNFQAAKAIGIAYEEEQQRLKNAKAVQALQSEEAGRTEILRLQQDLAIQRAEAAALDRGELQASNVELLKATELYQRLRDEQKRRVEQLAIETEELRKQNEFRKRIAEVDRDTGIVGAGLRSGRIGAEARAYEQGLRDFEGDIGKASQFADRVKKQEEQRLIWENLEKNIVDVSDAISGSLTNGLLDIISGARKVEDVGREMLDNMARSFADAAQQQLTALLQRQIAQFAGPKLAGMIGGEAQQATGVAAGVAGVQALGSASLAASGQVAAFGIALQTVMGQMALSGATDGITNGLTGGLSSALSGVAAGFFSPGLIDFGGFLAEGGIATAGKGYVVGEEEPEFFFPGVSGRVVPRSDMEKAQELRREDSKPEPIDVRYTVTEQQGQRFVTEEQYRKGNAALLQRAQAVTLGSMRNNKDTRDYVGI